MSTEIAKQLGGKVVGRVIDNAWRCECGERFDFSPTGMYDVTGASIALYLHRQAKHVAPSARPTTPGG